MNTRTIFGSAIVAMVIATPAAAQSDTEPTRFVLSDYFPAATGMNWTYEKLAPTATGNMRDRYVECTSVQRSDGERVVTMQTTTFLGSMKIPTVYVYAFSTDGSSLYLNETQAILTGAKKYFDRPVVIKMPTADASSSWTRDEVDNDGNVGSVYEYSAHVIPACSISTRAYRNVLQVTEKQYWMAGSSWAEDAEKAGFVPDGFSRQKTGKALFYVKSYFYASHVGLVKTVFYDKDGTLLGSVSSQLVQFSGQ